MTSFLEKNLIPKHEIRNEDVKL